MIISWDIEYENKSKLVSVYTQVCTPTIDAKNVSHTEDCITETTYKTKYYRGERIGLNVAGDICFDCNIEGNILSDWSVPIGDRNFKEFGRCMEHEKRKRVCKEIEII